MATIKYFIKGNRNPGTIYLRFTHGRKIDLTKSTHLPIPIEYWNNKKGDVRNIGTFTEKQIYQNKLNELRSNIINKFIDDFANGEQIDGDWLEDQIRVTFGQPKELDHSFLSEFAKSFIKNAPNKIQKNGTVGLAKSTITKYNSTLKKIEEFESFKKAKTKLIDVNFKFHEEFIHFLHDIQQLNFNTIGKYLSNIKAFCKAAKKDGLKIHQDVEHEDFRVPKEETDFITLDFDEIDQLYDHDFSNQPILDNAKRWLILSVWIGARASDLLSLTDKNLIDGYIEYKAQKTNQKITAAIHPQAKKVIEFGFPYKISTQKYNDFIKEVCREVGINKKVKGSKNINISKSNKEKIYRKVKGEYEKWELVTSHIGRRSFATNNYGKEIPTTVLMAQTGHTTEKMFLQYIGKSEKGNAQLLKNHWEKNM